MLSLGQTNKYICQWLFFRIFKHCDSNGKVLNYGILFPVLPLTGWKNDYKPKNILIIHFRKKVRK